MSSLVLAQQMHVGQLMHNSPISTSAIGMPDAAINATRVRVLVFLYKPNTSCIDRCTVHYNSGCMVILICLVVVVVTIIIRQHLYSHLLCLHPANDVVLWSISPCILSFVAMCQVFCFFDTMLHIMKYMYYT